MGFAANFGYYLFHPYELRAIIQWSIFHQPVHQRDEESEPISLRACFDLLEKTSRSFSAVIQELNPELLVPVCLFYLVLRGLDTVEDDMTIALSTKDPILRDFYNILDKDGWTFDGCGPNEKDRELLVRFHYVITEFKKIKEPYRVIIKDVAKRMGNGMADYCQNAEFNEKGVDTVEDYELYCHYVAGLVGEGLTRLFVESGLANPVLLQRKDLHESMGQLLQQTNIIRDIAEDNRDGRRFWPRQIWSKYVDKFDDLFKPENQEIAMRCSSEMVLTALERVPDCLFYLAGIRDQSVFNFTAIPQSMAIATIELCFRNPAIFQRNVKITKGQACRLMMQSSQNLQILYGTFKEYARRIHKKNDPRDPNFLKISVACGKIEQFVESVFPSQDAKSIANGNGQAVQPAHPNLTAEEAEKKRKDDEEAKRDIYYISAAVMGIMMFIGAIMIFIAWLAGARFDLAIRSLWDESVRREADERSASIKASYQSHREL